MSDDDAQSEWRRRYDRSVEAEERQHLARDTAQDDGAAFGLLRVVVLLTVGSVAAAGWAVETNDGWTRILAGALCALAMTAAVGMVIGWLSSR